MADEAWEQSALPASLGGLGMQKASDIALPAYISSVTASRDLVAVIVPTNRLAERNAELFVQWQVQTETGAQPLDNDRKKTSRLDKDTSCPESWVHPGERRRHLSSTFVGRI